MQRQKRPTGRGRFVGVDQAHAPDMHQAKKVNPWHFGMKAHIGADADSGIARRVTAGGS